MTNDSGIIVEWLDISGNPRRGVIRYMKQHSTFARHKKSLVTLFTNMTETIYQKDHNGKKVSIIMKDSELDKRGFID